MVDHELITLLAHEELDIDTALRRLVWRFAAPNGSALPE
jgi:hypothetical protein